MESGREPDREPEGDNVRLPEVLDAHTASARPGDALDLLELLGSTGSRGAGEHVA